MRKPTSVLLARSLPMGAFAHRRKGLWRQGPDIVELLNLRGNEIDRHYYNIHVPYDKARILVQCTRTAG